MLSEQSVTLKGFTNHTRKVALSLEMTLIKYTCPFICSLLPGCWLSVHAGDISVDLCVYLCPLMLETELNAHPSKKENSKVEIRPPENKKGRNEIVSKTLNMNYFKGPSSDRVGSLLCPGPSCYITICSSGTTHLALMDDDPCLFSVERNI